jgi:hypothetical protein
MQRIILTLIVLFGINYSNFLLGQINAPPVPCTNGAQNTCQCINSPLLCSMSVLNGYNYQMTTYLHPQDGPGNGPAPMCAGASGNTTAHNPTWFRFLAWCPDIDLSVLANMCTTQGGCRGIQLAVFPECNWQNPNNAVACEVSDCLNPGQGTSHTLTVSMTGLIVGQTYSMVVDGCCNSACNVTITVTSPPCNPEIDPWPGPIMGEELVCVGSTHQYEVEIPDGGIKFQWYLDGVPFDGSELTPGNPFTGITRTWTTPGTYQLCVDTYNGCVTLANNPMQICKTIKVYDAEAGTITAQPTPVCPTGTVNINVSGNSTSPDISQYILIVDASGTIVKVHQGTATTFTWPTCGVFTAYSYNYVTALGLAPVEGDPFSAIQADCTSNTTCCELESVTFEFALLCQPCHSRTIVWEVVQLQEYKRMTIRTVMGVQSPEPGKKQIAVVIRIPKLR